MVIAVDQMLMSGSCLSFYVTSVALSQRNKQSYSLALQFLDYPLLSLRPKSVNLLQQQDVLVFESGKSCFLDSSDSFEAVHLAQQVRWDVTTAG